MQGQSFLQDTIGNEKPRKKSPGLFMFPAMVAELYWGQKPDPGAETDDFIFWVNASNVFPDRWSCELNLNVATTSEKPLPLPDTTGSTGLLMNPVKMLIQLLEPIGSASSKSALFTATGSAV
jgi:hypothetical protein